MDQDGLRTFFQGVAKRPLLTHAETLELCKRAELGDVRAREKLVEHNMRLAISMAKGFRAYGVPFEDLIQEAMIGLQKAVDKFDRSKGYRFSTYATWWIRKSLQNAVELERQVRVPGHVVSLQRRARAHFEANPGCSYEDAALALEVSVEQIEIALKQSHYTVSLDAAAEGDASLYDGVRDKTEMGDDPALLIAESLDDHQREALEAALDRLPDVQRRVVRLRFGFEGAPQSREQIARAMGFTGREYIVQRALRAGMKALKADMGGTILDELGAPGRRPGSSSGGVGLTAGGASTVPVCAHPSC